MPKNNVLPKGEFFTTIPDHFLSQIMTELSASELRVMLYIYLHTLGYGKLTDAISYEQFLKGVTTRAGQQLDKGAGVSRRSLVTALASLEERGLISRQKQGYRAATIRLEVATPTDETTENVQQQESKTVVKTGSLVAKPTDTVQTLPELSNKSMQKLHLTCRESQEHEENMNRGQSSPTNIILESEKIAIKLIIEKITSLDSLTANRLVKIAFNKHGRDLGYIERLLDYVTQTVAIQNPAAVFTSLLKQDADRTLAGTPRVFQPVSKSKETSLSEKSAESSTNCKPGNETQFTSLLIRKGLVTSPAKASYIVQLAAKNKLSFYSLHNLISLASGSPAGQRSSTFEFLFNQAIERVSQKDLTRPARTNSVALISSQLDLSKFAPGGKYAHVAANKLPVTSLTYIPSF